MQNTKQNAQSFFDTSSSESTFFSPSVAHQAINRKCEKCEHEEKKVQRSEKASAVKDASGNVPSYIASLDGKGAPLPDSVKKFFEPKFKADFSSVRIHDNEQAAEAASSVHAKAFTHKNHIVFNKGVYNPESSAGRELLAHELTHIVQQNGGISRMEVEKQ
ncbi:DUF4157 domain-containing protein, partial [Ohtaekwangia sp.]|uniref:eCIS core domain-containing protein n=1 Tax=Ohtaekwangia sp. TaxID=2066019 RepID=UPI002F94139C